MATEEYQIGYEAGYQDGFNAAQQPQAEAVPSSDLDPDEGDPVTLWAEIWRLREAVKGPDGYATWQDAATAERILRVRVESKNAGAAPLAWIRHDWSGTGQRTLTFDGPTYPAPVRDEVVNPVWTPLFAAPQQAEAVPPGYVLAPIDVLKAASESLGNFVSDHGWTDLDMQAMDNIDAILAQQKGGV